MSASSIRRAESVLKITVQRDGTGDFTTISEKTAYRGCWKC